MRAVRTTDTVWPMRRRGPALGGVCLGKTTDSSETRGCVPMSARQSVPRAFVPDPLHFAAPVVITGFVRLPLDA